VWGFVEGTPNLDGRRVLVLSVVALAFAAVALPRRLWPALPALVVAGFLVTAVLAWERLADPAEVFVLADEANRTWVDDATPDGSRATTLYRPTEECRYPELTRHAFFLTEFFNTAVDRAAGIGDSTPDGLPADRVDVESGGRLLLTDGTPLVADYVVTQPGLELDGRRVAEGTGAGLVLWETRGAVRTADAGRRNTDRATADCD
jgi:hypothetical protein